MKRLRSLLLVATLSLPGLARADDPPPPPEDPYPVLPPASPSSASAVPARWAPGRTRMRSRDLFIVGLLFSAAGAIAMTVGAVEWQVALSSKNVATGIDNGLHGLLTLAFGTPALVAGLPMTIVGALPVPAYGTIDALPHVTVGLGSASLRWSF